MKNDAERREEFSRILTGRIKIVFKFAYTNIPVLTRRGKSCMCRCVPSGRSGYEGVSRFFQKKKKRKKGREILNRCRRNANCSHSLHEPNSKFDLPK